MNDDVITEEISNNIKTIRTLIDNYIKSEKDTTKYSNNTKEKTFLDAHLKKAYKNIIVESYPTWLKIFKHNQILKNELIACLIIKNTAIIPGDKKYLVQYYFETKNQLEYELLEKAMHDIVKQVTLIEPQKITKNEAEYSLERIKYRIL
ncbi:MAG: hypothetical protein ACP5N1_07220 [Candidatus Woesearchaeota archaeon]